MCPYEDALFMEAFWQDEVESVEELLRLKASQPPKTDLDTFLPASRTKAGASPVQSPGTTQCAGPFRVKGSCHLPDRGRRGGAAMPLGTQRAREAEAACLKAREGGAAVLRVEGGRSTAISRAKFCTRLLVIG
ncbi:UNVERIFIED_CONTAM: hypothetical protein FKN15_071526 [Acipenser sinensis]